jgi:hypothetical protein
MSGDHAQAIACELAGSPHRTQFRVGGVSVRVEGNEYSDVTLVSSLKPFRVEADLSQINIEIQIGRMACLPAMPGRELFDSGSVWRLFEADEGYRFDFRTPAMGDGAYKRLLVDREFRRASLLINNEILTRVEPAAAPLDYPLDELLIMHRLTQEKAVELHGCGIVTGEGIGNLFVGHSGAGKSTTTRLWTAFEDVEVLSDDRIIVRRDQETRDEAIREEQERSGCMRMYGTPWHGEAAYASPGSAPLARIFVLQHGRGNRLTPLSRSQAVAELFARSFVPFHRHEYVDAALEFLQELVDAVPCYRYAFEPNQGAVERILNFRD